MVQSNVYEMLPYYVQLEDRKRGGLVRHLCEMGVQPQIEAMKQAIASRDVVFRPDVITSNDFIEWVGGIFGLISYEKHWIGIGLNPEWTPHRMRGVVQQIYDYWENKGSRDSFSYAFDLWLREDYSNLAIEIKEEVPIIATLEREIDSLRLWDYYTPFDYNFLKPLTNQKILGVGDRFELRQDYIGKEVVTIEKRGWEKKVLELEDILLDTLSIEDNLTVKGFRIRDNLILEKGRFREVEEVIQEVEVNQPIISRMQRSHLWENNIIRKISLVRNEGADISSQWNSLVKELKALSIEATNLTKTPYHYLICQTISEVEIIRNRASLTGIITNDYVNIRPFLAGNNFTLCLDFGVKKRYLMPTNYYWQNENTRFPMIEGIVEENNYILNARELVLEFPYHSGIEERLEGISLELEGRIETLESMVFSEPLDTENCSNLKFQFIISLSLQ